MSARAAIILCCFFAATASAATGTERALNQINLNFQVEDLDYDETPEASGTSLDSVEGQAPGLGVRFSKVISDIYTEVTTSIHQDDMTYIGGYMSGSQFIPSKIDTQNFIATIGGKLGWVYNYDPLTAFVPYIEYGWRRWDREVPPVVVVQGIGINGYTEIYQNMHYDVGLKLLREVYEDLTVIGAFSVGRTFDSQLQSNINRMGVSVGLKEQLPSRSMKQGDVELDWHICKNLHLNTGVHYNRFGFRRSAVSVVGLYEPTSTTSEWIARVGFAYDFMA